MCWFLPTSNNWGYQDGSHLFTEESTKSSVILSFEMIRGGKRTTRNKKSCIFLLSPSRMKLMHKTEKRIHTCQDNKSHFIKITLSNSEATKIVSIPYGAIQRNSWWTLSNLCINRTAYWSFLLRRGSFQISHWGWWEWQTWTIHLVKCVTRTCNILNVVTQKRVKDGIRTNLDQQKKQEPACNQGAWPEQG